MAPLIPSSLLVLLLLSCPADASATPAPAPAPAATGLQAEETCLGYGTHSQSLACVANVALSCLGADAVTGESTFLACFLAGSLTEQCWAGPRKAEEEGCIGIGISKDRERCLGEFAWSCRGSAYGEVGFILCFFEDTITCLL